MIKVEKLTKIFGEVVAGASQFEPAFSLAVLGGVAVLFLALGSYSFSRIQL